MLSFRWVLGDMTDNSPGEIPALLADLANADEEHVDVGFGKGDYGVGVLADRWITIEDVEGDSPSISHRERRSVGPDRHDGSGGRARGGAGEAPGTTRGGGVSKSVAKAPRDRIGRG